MSINRQFQLRNYPEISQKFHAYCNYIGSQFIDELSPFLKSIPKEAVSEGDAEIVERADGTQQITDFEDFSVTSSLSKESSIYSKFDDILSLLHDIAFKMVAEQEKYLFRMIYSQSNASNIINIEDAMGIENWIYNVLEKTDLSFDEEGVMVGQFIIPPDMVGIYEEIMSKSRLRELIDRKRKEFYAKKRD